MTVKRNPETQWTCMECGRHFTREYSMLTHMRTAHGAPFTEVNPVKRTGKPLQEAME